MHWIFRSLTDRLKALFVADVALDLEAQFLVRQADRKVEMLDHADELERDGFETVAAELRQQADAISVDRPMASVLPAVGELSEPIRADSPLLVRTGNGTSDPNRRPKRLAPVARGKKTTKRKGR